MDMPEEAVSLADLVEGSIEDLIRSPARRATILFNANHPVARKMAVLLREYVCIHIKHSAPMSFLQKSRVYIAALSDLADSYEQMPSKISDALLLREIVLAARKSMQKGDVEAKQRHARTCHKLKERNRALRLRIEIFEELIPSVTNVSEHPNSSKYTESQIEAISELAISICSQGRLGQALVMRKAVMDWRRRFLGSSNHDTLVSKRNYAISLLKLEEYALAQAYLTQLFVCYKYTVGLHHPVTLQASLDLARAYTRREPWRAYMIAREAWLEWIEFDHISECEMTTKLETEKEMARALEQFIQENPGMRVVSDENTVPAGTNVFEECLAIRKDIHKRIASRPGSTRAQVLLAENDIAGCHMANQDYQIALKMRTAIILKYEKLDGYELSSVRRGYQNLIHAQAINLELLAKEFFHTSLLAPSISESGDSISSWDSSEPQQTPDPVTSSAVFYERNDKEPIDTQEAKSIGLPTIMTTENSIAINEKRRILYLDEAILMRRKLLVLQQTSGTDVSELKTIQNMLNLSENLTKRFGALCDESIRLKKRAFDRLSLPEFLGSEHPTVIELGKQLFPLERMRNWRDGVIRLR